VFSSCLRALAAHTRCNSAARPQVTPAGDNLSVRRMPNAAQGGVGADSGTGYGRDRCQNGRRSARLPSAWLLHDVGGVPAPVFFVQAVAQQGLPASAYKASCIGRGGQRLLGGRGPLGGGWAHSNFTTWTACMVSNCSCPS